MEKTTNHPTPRITLSVCLFNVLFVQCFLPSGDFGGGGGPFLLSKIGPGRPSDKNGNKRPHFKRRLSYLLQVILTDSSSEAVLVSPS